VLRSAGPSKFGGVDNLVARLHRALVDALLQHRPNAADQPVTVAEIYQDLVPYRSVRSSLGFALNADYEHALLQLLAGAEDLARIEPAEVRETLRLELESPNPNVGMFRNYAACDVFITIPEGFEPSTRGNGGDSHNWESVVSGKGLPDPVQAARDFSARRSPDSHAGVSPRAASTSSSSCTSCGKALPNGRTVRFCPFCGHDQTKRECRACHEPIEAGWRFCVKCGAST